jgi:phosphatidylglycerol:prolipoprotein diacylglycerol transferase
MINPVIIQLGPFSIRWYALLIMSGVILAVYLAMREAKKKRIIPDDILDFILIAFPIAIVGARLYYVVFDWSNYSQNLSEIFAIWHGGLAVYGGLISGALVLLVFSYYRAINPIDFLDIAAPGVMIAQAIGRWGNFVNQEAYGKAVEQLNYLPNVIRNQMYIDGSYRIPTFLYESVWNVVGFIIIMVLRRKPRFLKQGEIFSFYLVWYGCGRFVIEGMRTDSLMFFGLRVSQWLSIILVLTGLIFVFWRRKQKDVPYYSE